MATNKENLIVEKLDKIISLLSNMLNCGCNTAIEHYPTIMLFDFINDWFETYKKPYLKDSGYDMRNTIKKHILPNIENEPLTNITGIKITKALSKIDSMRMRQIVRNYYSQIFNKAISLNYLSEKSNPIHSVVNVNHQYKNGRSLTQEEQAAFIEEARKDSLFFLFRFYLLTGVRPSEPLTVFWEDITEDSLRIRGTKTKLSDRTIPLSSELKHLLDSIPRVDERIFPYTYERIRKHFDNIVARLPFDLTLKDLRHTFGTRCIESGVSLKAVQKWMGHSTYKTTETIYIHVLNEFEQKEMAKLKILLSESNQN